MASAPVQDLGTREAALRFLLDRIDYERAQVMPYDPRRMGLDRMRSLLARLDHPEGGVAVVHVAGTKGKGSTSAMVAAMLSASGYHTGLFTSPHLERLEERMIVDGRPCDATELTALVRRVRPAVEELDREAAAQGGDATGPTYFEITTAMALLHFAAKKTPAAVLEVGLGGRLDATNVCTPLVSVITSISFDHTQQLGNTLTAIAGEKAGIIKPGVPVVSGVAEPEPREVIRRTCRERGCRLVELGADFAFDYEPPRHLQRAAGCGRVGYQAGEGRREYPLGLIGRHQAANAAVALAVADELRRGGWTLPEAAVQGALGGLTWPARVEVVARRPAVVVDAAHNVASIEALVAALDESFSPTRRLLLFATTRDKDVRGMLERLVGRFDHMVLTRYRDNPRAVPPEELATLAAELTGRRWPVYDDPADAWVAVRRQAAAEDLVCVTGSFFIAAEIKRLLSE